MHNPFDPKFKGNYTFFDILQANLAYTCSTCGVITDSANTRDCPFGCGALSGIELIDEIIEYQGINICPACEGWYAGWADMCKQCYIPLRTVTKMKEPPVRSPNQELFPCPKCSGKKSLPMSFCDYCGRLLQTEFSYYHANDNRPTIPIKLRNGDRTITNVVLIDFGASITLLHGFLATSLGVDFSKRLRYNTNLPQMCIQVSGVAPSATITAYEASIEIGIQERFYKTRVYFSDDLPMNTLGMLGHYGFLDRFDVHADNVNRRIIVKEHDVLRKMQCKICPSCGKERKEVNSKYCWSCGASLVISPSVVNGSISSSSSLSTLTEQPVPIHRYQIVSTQQVQPVQVMNTTEDASVGEKEME